MNGIDKFKLVTGCAPAALTSTAGDGDYISMKGFGHLTVMINVLNGTTVTGGAVTFLQATDVAATGAKALSFDTMYANADCAASDALTETAVTAGTFTTSTTNSKQLMYVVEFDAEDLDVDNGFDCLRVDVASMANAVGAVTYILSDSRYSPAATSAITN